MLEFRAEVISWSLNSILWALLSLVTVNLIFGQVSSIAGWTKNEVLILSITGSMFNSFLWMFVLPSLLYIGETIRKGDFDFYLLRPINSQFLSAISRFEFNDYLRIVAMIVLLFRFVPQAVGHVAPLQIIGFTLLFLLGLVIYYSLFSIITTLCFWFIGLQALEDLFDTMVTMGRYPTDIFNGALRIVFFYLIPMAFVATFPVSVLLGKSGLGLIIIGFFVAAIFLFFSSKFWNFALRHYSSASS